MNLTIEGDVCSTGAGLGISRPADATRLYVGAGVTNGSVDALHLPNSWLSPTATVEANVLGTDLGRTTVGAYRSDIVTEGPRGGPFGALSASENHTWTEVGVFVRTDSAGAREGILVAVWFLDMMPDGCFVRTQSGLQDTPCPSTVGVFNLVPTPTVVLP